MAEWLSFLVIVLFWGAVWASFWGRAENPFSVGRTLACLLGLWVCLQGWPVLPVLGFDVIGIKVWRGIWGELSVASGCLMAMMWAKVITRWRSKEACLSCWRPLVWAVALLGAVAYPPMLGLGMIDPYVWGYQSSIFLVGLCTVCLLMLWLDMYVVCLWLAGAILAWYFKVFESVNLWDYLLDPIAWCLAMGYCVKDFRVRVFKKE